MTTDKQTSDQLSSEERKELLMLRKLKWCCQNVHSLYIYLTDDSIRTFFQENEYVLNRYDSDEDQDVFERNSNWIFVVPKRKAVRQKFLGEIIKRNLRGKNLAEKLHVIHQMLPERGPWCDDWYEHEDH